MIEDKESDKLYLVMDFVEKGAIFSKGYYAAEGPSKKPNNDILSEDKALYYFRQLLCALDYCNNSNKKPL